MFFSDVCSHLPVSHMSTYLSYSQCQWLILLQMQSQVLSVLSLKQLNGEQKPTSLRLRKKRDSGGPKESDLLKLEEKEH